VRHELQVDADRDGGVGSLREVTGGGDARPAVAGALAQLDADPQRVAEMPEHGAGCVVTTEHSASKCRQGFGLRARTSRLLGSTGGEVHDARHDDGDDDEQQ
jgi:hypothetical protein